jgi:hypothetical protein
MYARADGLTTKRSVIYSSLRPLLPRPTRDRVGLAQSHSTRRDRAFRMHECAEQTPHDPLCRCAGQTPVRSGQFVFGSGFGFVLGRAVGIVA